MAKGWIKAGAVAGMLLLWELAALSHLWPSYLFPGPADVAVTLWRLGGNGMLLAAVMTTVLRMLIGFFLAAALGLLLGMAMARSAWLAAILDPVVMGLQSMPSICWFPLAILWIGLNEGAILFVTTVGALFAVASATALAIRNIPTTYLHAAATMGARGSRLYTRVMLPAAMPTLLTGLRVGWSFSWRSLMAAELLFMNLGLGYLLQMGRDLADAAQVMAVILVVLVMGLLVDKCFFAWAEAKVRQRWGFEA